MSDTTRRVTKTIQECIDILNFSEYGPGAKLPGIEWSYFLACISCNQDLLKYKKSAEAAQDVKNIAEGKSKAEGDKVVASWEEFCKQRTELQKKHAKMADGQPVVVNQTVIMEDQSAFQNDFQKLREEHLDAIVAREAQIKRVQEKLATEVCIELPTIAKDDLPDGITREALGPLAMLIR